MEVEIELSEEAVQRSRVFLKGLVAEHVLIPTGVVVHRELWFVRNVLTKNDNNVFIWRKNKTFIFHSAYKKRYKC